MVGFIDATVATVSVVIAKIGADGEEMMSIFCIAVKLKADIYNNNLNFSL